MRRPWPSRARRRGRESAGDPGPAEESRETPEVESGGPAEPEEARERRPGLRESLGAVRGALSSVGRRRVLVAGMGIIGFGLATVLVFSGFSFWWTSQPSFCARCHVMEPYIAAWRESPHREVNCERCHLHPGVFGFLGGKIASLQVVMNYVRGQYEDWSFNAAVLNAACLQCHEDIMEHNVHGRGIVVSHKNIIGTGGKCMSCHSTVAHGPAVPLGSETHPTMATCLKCHNDQTAPLRCSLCHTGKVSPSPAEAMTSPAPGG